MRIDGRRRSGNIEDRRGVSGKAVGIGGGILGAIVIGIITLISGGDLGDVARNVMSNQSQQPATSQYVETAEDKQLADFVSVVLAGTGDVWTKIFREEGWGEYEPPKMVLFHGSVRSGPVAEMPPHRSALSIVLPTRLCI